MFFLRNLTVTSSSFLLKCLQKMAFKFDFLCPNVYPPFLTNIWQFCGYFFFLPILVKVPPSISWMTTKQKYKTDVTVFIFRGSFREANMEHRTLKPRENLIEKPSLSLTNSGSNANIHYQNMKNLQQLVQTIEGYSHHRELDLPPPARILPYSGIKPQVNIYPSS